MIKEIAKAFNQIGDYFRNRPQRLRKQALDAAEHYIELNETGIYKGEVVSKEYKEQLMIHFRKRFFAWRDGN